MIDVKVLKGVRVRHEGRSGQVVRISYPWVTIQWDDERDTASYLRSHPDLDEMELQGLQGWSSMRSWLSPTPARRVRTEAEAVQAALGLLTEGEGFKGNPYDISKDNRLKPTRGMRFNYKQGPYDKARTKANRWDCKCPGNNASGYDCTCKDKENPTRKPKRFKVAAGGYKNAYMRAWRKFRAQKKA